MTLRRKNRAQALVMVTFALFAIIGLIGLAVDFGWAYFLEKNMQAAADAAALAAVTRALEDSPTITTFACGGPVGCVATKTPCTDPAITGNLIAGCQYAAQNGFSAANAGTNVTVQAWDDSGPPTVSGCNPTVEHPPTAPCVDTIYWVTVRIAQEVPQLFSAIWGNNVGIVSARATAAIAESEVIASLILINREFEATAGVLPQSTNMEVQGSGTVRVPGGIILASNSNTNGREAGRLQGSGQVITPFTYIRNPGTIGGNAAANWSGNINNTLSGGIQFEDPMWQKGGQPPINVNPNLPMIPVPGGALNNSICPSGACPPGIYYATRTLADGSLEPTGAQISIGNNQTVSFHNPGGVAGTVSGTFGDWMFIGGLVAGNNSVINMAPGRYVYAGVADTRNSVINIPNGVTVTGGSGENLDAGRLMVLTNFKPGGYSGQLDSIWARYKSLPNANNVSWIANDSGLSYAKASLQAGQNDRSRVALYGLNALGTNADVLSTGLDPFAPSLIWQDQGNSYVKYTNGVVDYSSGCGGTSLNQPCMTSPAPNPADAPQLEIWATPYAQWGGLIYQPRGAWTLLQASGTYTGPLMIVSGGMKVQGTPDLTLTGPSVPLTIFVPSLIE
jgi:hypothetical protein